MTPDRSLLFTLRSYQNEALESFEHCLARGENQFHLVAPPGSGKTIMGIAMMLHAGRKSVIFSPNAAIQSQWKHRFYESTDILNGTDSVTTSISSSIIDNPSYLNLSYQAITVKERNSDELHSNAQTLFDYIVENDYSLLILDECHHLTSYWAEVLIRLSEAIPDVVVIGLTATPPIEADKSNVNTYLTLIGDVDYEIPLPLLVKQKNLAPYQDLVYFTLPSELESAEYVRAQNELSVILKKLDTPEEGRIPLSLWANECLEESRFKGKVHEPQKILRSKPDMVIAYARYTKTKGMKLPITMPLLDEMELLPTIDDYAILIGDYIQENTNDERYSELNREAINIFRDIGYTYSGKSFVQSRVGSASSLALSESKLLSCRTILRQEYDFMTDALRALVLVDFEFGRKGKQGITAVDVMNMMTTHEDVDVLDPIMLTGKSVLVDDDLLPSFMDFVEKFRSSERVSFELETVKEYGYIRVDGSGRDWNSKIYVRMISRLFEYGISKCLISTRSLLGEGWDSHSCNTLIDLTITAGFVSVNQIRGRTIRKDPNNEHKCANNWDVVTIMPDVHFGLYDFQRLQRKFEHFFGLSEDGVIEKGLGHVHPLFAPNSVDLMLKMHLKINKEMLKRCTERFDVYEKWYKHELIHNEEHQCCELQFSIDDVRDPVTRTSSDDEFIVWAKALFDRQKKGAIARIGGIGIGIFAVSLLFAPSIVLPAALAALYTGIELVALNAKRGKLHSNYDLDDDSMETTLNSFSYVVLETGKGLGIFPDTVTIDDVSVTLRSDNCFRIVLQNVSSEVTDIFTSAIWEMLGPIQNHRYIIERRRYIPDRSQLTASQLKHPETIPTEIEAWHPVPSLFGAKRSFADEFEKQWNALIGHGKVHYTRSEAGQEILSSCFRKRPLEIIREKKTIWE